MIVVGMENATSNIHSSAVIHPDAKLGKGVIVGPGAVIGENVVIGDGTKIVLTLLSAGGQPSVRTVKSIRVLPLGWSHRI